MGLFTHRAVQKVKKAIVPMTRAQRNFAERRRAIHIALREHVGINGVTGVLNRIAMSDSKIRITGRKKVDREIVGLAIQIKKSRDLLEEYRIGARRLNRRNWNHERLDKLSRLEAGKRTLEGAIADNSEIIGKLLKENL